MSKMKPVVMTSGAPAHAVNPCSLCAPLGAAIAFKGFANTMTLLHGSQGCATYIRRFIISHFREPVDIASSSFTEDTVIFGDASNLKEALTHIRSQYLPDIIGVATTCLAETIGDDCSIPIREFLLSLPLDDRPVIVSVNTPSYRDAHSAGFVSALTGVVKKLAQQESRPAHFAIIPGLVSPADIRYIKEISKSFSIPSTVFPDFSDTLDGPTWSEYAQIPRGGTPKEDILALGNCATLFDWTAPISETDNASRYLNESFGIPVVRTPPPIGVSATQRFLEKFSTLQGQPIPAWLALEQGRLLDSYVDGHKYVAGKHAIVFGEESLVVGLAEFLYEIGIVPVICATGSINGSFEAAIRQATGNNELVRILQNANIDTIGSLAQHAKADLILGSSKGQKISNDLGIPLIRVGFPIHDRFGGQRQLHIGYRGAQELFDRIINAMLSQQQEHDGIGYAYY
jgi:nitrogenase molybdenum-iron protein NifN